MIIFNLLIKYGRRYDICVVSMENGSKVFIVWLNVKENDLVDDYFLDILYEDICIEIDDYHEVSSKDVQQFRIYFI